MQLNWVEAGGGRIALSHRPRLRAIRHFQDQGCNCLVTLLSEKEGAPEIGKLAVEAGLRWIWIPLASGNPPPKIPEQLREILELLSQGASVLIHCSAGMHRTGMISLAILRKLGYSPEEAFQLISRMRVETHGALQQKHIDWANSTVNQ